MLSLVGEEVDMCPRSRLGVLLTTPPAQPSLSLSPETTQTADRSQLTRPHPGLGHISSQAWPKDPRDVGPWRQLQGCGVLPAPR